MCGIFCTNTVLENGAELSASSKIRGPENTIEIVVGEIFLSFHRLAINGLDEKSNQPFCIDDIYLICNGEIYNSKELWDKLEKIPTTNSDCEIIIELYKSFGIEHTLQLLDGVFAIVIYDSKKELLFVARDPFGVRPLFHVNFNGYFGFASEAKQLKTLGFANQFQPGSYCVIYKNARYDYTYYTLPIAKQPSENYHLKIYESFESAVNKRINTTDREIGCLLSGGLDSSCVTALVQRKIKNLNTFSIGLKGSTDIENSRKVAQYLKTNHHEVILSEKEFLDAIPEVIKVIESYDVTTVRASVGNYLIGKYIAKNTNCKVIFNGDGADELMGGYLYFKNAPNDLDFDFECRRLLRNIYMFDVLRSDRSMGGNGLEARTPFLDKNLVQDYLSIPSEIRYSKHKMEKKLFRDSIYKYGNKLLPSCITYRIKEAFSDGVSSEEYSWYSIIQDKVKDFIFEKNFFINQPLTNEQKYYRYLFEEEYPYQGLLVPYFWMPKWTNTKDPSARTI